MKNFKDLTVFIFFIGLIGSLKSVFLPKFNVDIKDTSVSGLSSGAFFANQVQVALSSIIRGAGIIAGGPYDCGAQHSFITCGYNNSPSVSMSIYKTNQFSDRLEIDNTSNLKNQKVYMISGTKDMSVSTSVMNQLYKYLVTEGNYIPANNVVYKHDLPSGHTFPTDFNSTGNSNCRESISPYISNCGFDGAGAILNQIYGPLKDKRVVGQTGHFIEFSQSEFISFPSLYGLDSKGFAYIPKACSDGQKCRLHIAFHGCSQYYSKIGDKFVKNTGYDRWADTNNIIVVFPQTSPDYVLHLTPTNLWANNMNGCWDWIGWYGTDFDTKNGKQIQFIKNIIHRIAK